MLNNLFRKKKESDMINFDKKGNPIRQSNKSKVNYSVKYLVDMQRAAVFVSLPQTKSACELLQEHRININGQTSYEYDEIAVPVKICGVDQDLLDESNDWCRFGSPIKEDVDYGNLIAWIPMDCLIGHVDGQREHLYMEYPSFTISGEVHYARSEKEKSMFQHIIFEKEFAGEIKTAQGSALEKEVDPKNINNDDMEEEKMSNENLKNENLEKEEEIKKETAQQPEAENGKSDDKAETTAKKKKEPMNPTLKKAIKIGCGIFVAAAAVAGGILTYKHFSGKSEMPSIDAPVTTE